MSPSLCRRGLLCFLLFVSAALARAEPVATLENIRVGQTPGNTRLVLDLDDLVQYKIEVRDSPPQLLVDLQDTKTSLDLEQLKWSGSVLDGSAGYTTQASGLGLVFHLSRVIEPHSFVLGPDDSGDYRLVIDLTEPALSAATQLTSIRLGRHPEYARFVIDLSAPVEYTLVNPSGESELTLRLGNVVIDPESVSIALGGSPVEAIRVDPVGDLAFTLSGPVEPRVFMLVPEGDRGHRLVLDLYPSQTEADSIPLAAAAVTEAVPPASRRSRARSTARTGGASERKSRDASAGALQFSGTWEQEWAVARKGGNQKFEAMLEPRVDMQVSDAVSMTAIGRVRIDTVGDLGPSVYRPFNYSAVNGPWYNDSNVGVELRELYMDMRAGDSFLRLGKQQVVWGQSDGIKVLDVVNPQSFREYILDDFDSSRIPLWMVNLETPLGPDGSVQLLWIPDTSYHELAEIGTPYELTSPLLVPQKPVGIHAVVREPDKPDNAISDSDLGARYRSFVGGWDLSLNYFYSYNDFPVPFQRLEVNEDTPVGVLEPRYKRNHLMGGTASNAFGDLSLRTEIAWSSDRWFTSSDMSQGGVEDSGEFSSVLGLDWQRSSSSLISGQWFFSRALDYQSTMVRSRNEQMVSLLVQQGFLNDSWEFRGLVLYSLDNEDSLYQVKLKYWLASDLELWLGADIFDGTSIGLFGQFDKYDRVLLGLQYGF